ncbi:MAG: hypothetical protein K2P58_03275 [Hyphomonadaceae bacterium]|nr:hypothetical protein [Hyphomonadaceae bacterium]
MLRFLLIATVVAVTGCTRGSDEAAPGCARAASHEVSWSSATPDTVTTRAEGPTCDKAVVTFVIRNPGGDPLWAFASTYHEMTAGGSPPEGAPPVTEDQIDTFLAGWADVTESRTSSLPEWRADAEALTQSATTFAYETPFDRETYQLLRGRDLPMACYAMGVETTQCLIIDPASNAPAAMVVYGP